MQRSYRQFLFVWLALLTLLALTCGSAFIPMGAWNSATNLLIAACKALLVILFFMRLRSSAAVIRIVAVIALGTVALLFTLSASDYSTRPMQRSDWQVPQQ